MTDTRLEAALRKAIEASEEVLDAAGDSAETAAVAQERLTTYREALAALT